MKIKSTKDIIENSFNQSRVLNSSKINFQDIPNKSKLPLTIKSSEKKIIKLENVKEKPKSLIDNTGNITINPLLHQNTVDLGKDISKNINIINNSDSVTKDNIYSFFGYSQPENFYFFSYYYKNNFFCRKYSNEFSELDYTNDDSWVKLLKKSKLMDKSTLATKILLMKERNWNKENIIISEKIKSHRLNPSESKSFLQILNARLKLQVLLYDLKT